MKTVITITSDPIGGSRVTVEVDDQKKAEFAVAPVLEPGVGSAFSSTPPAEVGPKAKPKNHAKFDHKVCPMCLEEFLPKKGNQVLCGKVECKKKKQREYAKKYAAEHYTAKPREKATNDNVDWCKHCNAFTTHATDGHYAAINKQAQEQKALSEGEFLPGHEKTPEELEEVRHTFKPILPGDPGYGGAPRGDSDERRAASRRAKEARETET